MNYQKYLKQLKHKTFWYGTAVDFISWGSIFLVFTLFTYLLNNWFVNLMQGRSPTQLQQIIQTAPETLVPLAEQLRTFAFVALIGSALLIFGALCFYAYSRSHLWHKITHKKQSFWPWVLIQVVLILPLILVLIVALILRLILLFILSRIAVAFVGTNVDTLVVVQQALNSLLNFMVFIILFSFIMLVYWHFSKKQSAWQAVGDAFKTFFTQYVAGLKVIGATLLIAVVLALLLYFIKLKLATGILSTIISLVLSACFVAFMRVKVLAYYDLSTKAHKK